MITLLIGICIGFVLGLLYAGYWWFKELDEMVKIIQRRYG